MKHETFAAFSESSLDEKEKDDKYDDKGVDQEHGLKKLIDSEEESSEEEQENKDEENEEAEAEEGGGEGGGGKEKKVKKEKKESNKEGKRLQDFYHVSFTCYNNECNINCGICLQDILTLFQNIYSCLTAFYKELMF